GLGVMGIPIAAGPGLASLLASGSHNLVLLRYALALVPLTAAAAGCALATLPRRLALSVLTVALAGSLAYSVAKGAYAPVTRTGQDIRGAAAFLARDAADGDILFVEPANDWMPLAYYGVATAPVEGRDGRWRVVSENEERRTENAGRRIWLVRFSRRTAAPPELLGRAVVAGRFGTITVLRVNQVR
ncbi:MAG: hypothetical protein H6Q10_2167, partial [Acidobacteria bacterium]|nr:hypothetical protein [Acidobacteriota bacterium]